MNYMIQRTLQKVNTHFSHFPLILFLLFFIFHMPTTSIDKSESVTDIASKVENSDTTEDHTTLNTDTREISNLHTNDAENDMNTTHTHTPSSIHQNEGHDMDANISINDEVQKNIVNIETKKTEEPNIASKSEEIVEQKSGGSNSDNVQQLAELIASISSNESSSSVSSSSEVIASG